MKQFPNILWAGRQALSLIATVLAVVAFLALVNRLVGLAWPGVVG